MFAPPQKDEFFDENNDNGPFAKKSGLFSGGGNSLFDEPEDDVNFYIYNRKTSNVIVYVVQILKCVFQDRLFSDSKEKAKKKEDKQEKEDKKEEEKEDKGKTFCIKKTSISLYYPYFCVLPQE